MIPRTINSLYLLTPEAYIATIIGSPHYRYRDRTHDFYSWEHLARVRTEDGGESTMLVSLAPSSSHMVSMEIIAWVLVREMALPVPQAAVLIMTQGQLRQAWPQLNWGSDDSRMRPVFAREDYDGAPARVDFDRALHLLAEHDDAATVFHRALPELKRWLVHLLLKPGQLEAMLIQLAKVAGTTLDAVLTQEPAQLGA